MSCRVQFVGFRVRIYCVFTHFSAGGVRVVGPLALHMAWVGFRVQGLGFRVSEFWARTKEGKERERKGKTKGKGKGKEKEREKKGKRKGKRKGK